MELLERNGEMWQIAATNTYMPGSLGWGYPLKSGYIKDGVFDEKSWIGAVSLYILSRASTVSAERQRINEMSITLYNQITSTSKTPKYATGDGKAAVGSIAYESINVIYSGLEKLIGEINSKGFEYDVNAINSEARSRKERAFTDLYLRNFIEQNAPDVAQMTGLQTTAKEKEALELETRLDKIHDNLYRDTVSAGCKDLLDDWMQKSGFDEWYRQTARQYVITNMACAVPTVDPFNFEVKLPYTDVSQFIWDVDCKDDHFKTAQYFIKFDYLSVNEVLEMLPNAKREDIERMSASAPSFYGLPVTRRHVHSSGFQILVATIRFLYVDTYEQETEKIKGIQISSQLVNNNQEIQAKLLTEKDSYEFRYQECYECKLIAGSIIARAEKCKYQLRSVDCPADTKVGSETLILGYALDPNSPSMATRVMGLQHYLNAVIFKMIELVGKMKGAILEIDFDYLYPLIPDNEKANIDANLAYIRDHGSIIKSSALSGDYRTGGASPPVLRIVDAGVPNQEINMLNQFSQMLISEIQTLMGLNQARVGQTPQYQAASSALSDLTQSNYATATMILEWDRFVERTLQTVMNYLKLSLYLKVKALGNNPDLVRSLFMRYGDEVVQMALDENMILEDVGVYVKRALESKAEKKMRIMKYVELGVQNKLITTLEAIKISGIEDPDDMEKYADRELRIQERKAQKQAEQQAQMQQQGEQQLLAQKQQGEAQMQNNKLQADAANQQNAAMAGITNSMVKDAMSGTATATNRAINTAGRSVQAAIPENLR